MRRHMNHMLHVYPDKDNCFEKVPMKYDMIHVAYISDTYFNAPPSV